MSDVAEIAPTPPKDKLFLSEKGHYLAWRLKSLKMEMSTTYKDLEDGNCAFHCLIDQIKTVLKKEVTTNHHVFRLQVCTSLLTNRHLQEWENTSLEEWIAKYSINEKHVSHMALQLAANMYKMKIYVYQLFECKYINFTIESVWDCYSV